MDLEDDIEQPWWRSLLRILGMLAGLALLAAVSMALLSFTARFIDKGERQQALPVFIDATSPPPTQDNARTRVPTPYAITWPDHPGRGAAVSFKGGRDQANDRTRGGGAPSGAGAPAQPAIQPVAKPDEVPIGLSAEEYREAVDSGKKLYLPNPQGNCDLGGQNAEKRNTLENCFAQRAAH